MRYNEYGAAVKLGSGHVAHSMTQIKCSTDQVHKITLQMPVRFRKISYAVLSYVTRTSQMLLKLINNHRRQTFDKITSLR